jgi:hypothetical protein
MRVERLVVTEAAIELIERLKSTHGTLLFHQSGCCYDGSSPICYPQHAFTTEPNDVFIGTIADCPFYISGSQYEHWKGAHLTIDVVKGQGSDFSIEASEGVRFLLRSRVFSPDEWAAFAASGEPLRRARPGAVHDGQ